MKWLAVAVVGMALLTSCAGGNANTDPRKGRVVIDSENCITGGCYTDWKACVGPDLLVSMGSKPFMVKAADECKP